MNFQRIFVILQISNLDVIWGSDYLFLSQLLFKRFDESCS